MGSQNAAVSPARYNQILLAVAGLGGLLYGIDVGIIAGALPYLQATSGYNAGQISFVVAAVLLGTIFSTLLAGLFSDWLGRKRMMWISGLLFVISIPIISLSHSFGALVGGRLLQGLSGGFIGVVVPLYLAECLGANNRGKGTAVFQWLLTAGFVVAAVVGIYFSFRVSDIEKIGTAAQVFAYKDFAWRAIFWVSMPPGILFILGALWVGESPRWLYRRGDLERTRKVLARGHAQEDARAEYEMIETATAAERGRVKGISDSLLRRKYVLPFLLACAILALNQATGVNSIIAYNTNILLQSGLTDVQAHWGYVIFTIVNFLATIVAVVLVDKKGRKFLLSLGTAGVVISLIGTSLLFNHTEAHRVDVRSTLQAMVTPQQTLKLTYNPSTAHQLAATAGTAGTTIDTKPTSLVVIYSCGSYRAATNAVRSDELPARPVSISRSGCLPANSVVGFFSNPFGNLAASRNAPLTIDDALITPLPSPHTGWLVAISLFCFMALYAVGPGVVVWLALSELMPTRIRSNGMSIALVINQAVSTFIAAVFLPTVGRYGYHVMFLAFAAATVLYFLIAFFLLPETKGKTLEQIEAYFEGHHPATTPAAAK